MSDMKCRNTPMLNAKDGNTIGWWCAQCDWAEWAHQPSLETLGMLLRRHNDDVVLEQRWYCILKSGEPRVFWDKASALQSASDWPSQTVSVIELGGTALNPTATVLWTPS